MATMDPTRYNELCRLCATKTTILLGVHIFQNNIGQLVKKIESCLPIQVHESDELPKMICENCLYKLNLLADFRDRTLRTERLLHDLYKEIHHQKIQQQEMVHDLIMVQNQQLLTNHNIDEIDLAQLTTGREPMIVGHEIILTQNVDLDNLNLNHHELTNPTLPAQATALVETANLDLIPQQHLLTDQFRLQHDLQVNINDPLNIKIGGSPQTYQHQITEEKKQQHQLITNGFKIDPKLEDSNSNNSLLIDEQLTDKQVYIIQTTDDSNNTLSNTSDWFYCNICGKACEEETSFEAHYETHFFKCNVCFAVFNNGDELNTHRKEAHGNTNIDKPIKTRLKRATLPIKSESNSEDSGGDFADDNDQIEEEDEEEEEEEEEDDGESVEKKKITIHEEEKQQATTTNNNNTKKKIWSPKVCTECGKTYKTNYKLNEHMRKHTGEKPYKCDSCDKEFRSKIGLAQHAAKHTGKYDYACPTCGKGFQCKSYLMVHQRVHSDVKPYPCTTCGRNFKTKQSLLDHTNRHLGVKPYMCETCGRGFITKGLCKAHQKVHTGLDNRKYSCKVCMKMFVSKSYLQTHLRIHTGEKPFICEVCGKGFLTKVDLRIHSTMHTGEKSYVCEMCGKAFARRDALRCHRRSHTGERPYSCDLCGQTFTQFTPMAIHKRLHTGERPYTCESCGKTFVSRSTMMSHAKKHLR